MSVFDLWSAWSALSMPLTLWIIKMIRLALERYFINDHSESGRALSLLKEAR